MSKNNLKFEGRITNIYDEESGISNAGNAWKSQNVRVLEEADQYPQDVVFKFFGDKVEKLEKFDVGDEVKVFFNLKSREWQTSDGKDRVSTEALGWKIEAIED